jgi:hypothetical protein
MRSIRQLPAFAALCMMLLAVGACTVPPRQTRFDVLNYQPNGEVERLHDVFDEAYYHVTPSGNVDIIARRAVRAAPGQPAVVQIVHLRTIFRAVPGTTYADRTMINGTATYAIVVGRGGTSFEGGCFLTFTEDKRAGVLTGHLEHARLNANRQVGEGAGVFHQAEVTGTFRAIRDPQKTVGLLNELNRFFGPQPNYQRPTDRPSPI